jgi:hypothetical protein
MSMQSSKNVDRSTRVHAEVPTITVYPAGKFRSGGGVKRYHPDHGDEALHGQSVARVMERRPRHACFFALEKECLAGYVNRCSNPILCARVQLEVACNVDSCNRNY